MRRRANRAGFSTVETMIAVTVLAIAVSGTLATHVAARNLTRSAFETEAAITALQAGMEQVLLNARDDIPAAFPDGTPLNVGDFGLEGLTVVPTYPNLGAGPTPPSLEIRLRATWTTFDQGQRFLEILSARGP